MDAMAARSRAWLGALAASLAACASGDSIDSRVHERAAALARSTLIIDTHIDVPDRLSRTPEDVGLRTRLGDFDYPRAREGGLDVAFMSIYVPARYQDEGGAKAVAEERIDMVRGIAAQHRDKFTLVFDSRQARALVGDARVGLAMGMENGAPIEERIENLQHFHAAASATSR
jgi:membrane dipeptidase